jgi:ribosomal protein L37AE/L43A
MNSKNTKYFLKKYPKLFKQYNLPLSETAMCWGLECGDGWFKLLDILCALLQNDVDNNGHCQIEFTQIKEKYGSLRTYTNISDDKQEGLLEFAEAMSNHICENCGTNVTVTRNKGGWISTLCKTCRNNNEKENGL